MATTKTAAKAAKMTRDEVKGLKPSANGKPAAREPRARKEGLRVPQIRVLQVLTKSKGPLSRSAISVKCGNKTTVVVGRAVGYSDPARRATFEQTKDGGGSPGSPCPSLLTLGYVKERELDVEGVSETVLELTPKGAKAFQALGKVVLPPLRD